MQSLSAQSNPFSQGSVLNTTPLSFVATGLGWLYRQVGFVQFVTNLQRVGEAGRRGPVGAAAAAAVIGVGAWMVVLVVAGGGGPF